MRALAYLSLLLVGCSLELASEEVSTGERNTCEATADCREGVCRSGACVASSGVIESVLVEITPPESVPNVGGARVYQVVDDLRVGRDGLALELPRRARVNLLVQSASVTGCKGDKDTLPVRATFTPRQRTFGLSGSYTTTSNYRLRGTSGACDSELTANDAVYSADVDVPAGEYDVYVERADLPDDENDCRFSPAALRPPALEAGQVCLILPLPEPELLRVEVEWPGPSTGPSSLDGWLIDVVHPVTGQRLSERHAITGDTAIDLPISNERPEGGVQYTIGVPFNPISSAGDELVRLAPPEGVVAPVIQLARSALTAATAGVARIAHLRQFPAAIELQGWVWRGEELEAGLGEIPVEASVTLTATSLDGIEPGVFASYSASATAGETGRLAVPIMPGEYRVRVVPPALSGLSAFETTLEARCKRLARDPNSCEARTSNTPDVVQAGKTLLVPDAAVVNGRVASPLGVTSIDDASVVGEPGVTRVRRCAADAGADCEPVVADLLDYSQGNDRFVPRSVSTLVDRGRFSLDETDCALCETDNGALYDFFVRPLDGSGHPWAVRPGVLVDGDLDLGSVTVSLPVLHEGTVRVPQSGEPFIVPGALIRAYVFRDARGNVLDDGTTPACADLPPGSGEPCVRSLLQVAETRADEDGAFRMFLPSVLW